MYMQGYPTLFRAYHVPSVNSPHAQMTSFTVSKDLGVIKMAKNILGLNSKY